MSDALTRSVVKLPASAPIAAVEDSWNASVYDARSAEALELDMSDCTFIEKTSLIFVISRLVQRQRHGLQTVLRLPKQRTVRDFFRDWGFPTGVSDATGVPFKSFVVEDDHHYFGERSAITTPASRWTSTPTLPSHAFPIRTFFAASREFGQRLAASQTAEWQQRYVLSVLNHHLGGRGRRVATHIVHEAIMNAVRHPKATLVQTVSHFSPPGTRGVGSLTITVWDDGLTIYETLTEAMTQGVQFQPIETHSLDRHFDVIIETSEGTKQSLELKSTDMPSMSTPAELVLLSSFFPGVTSAPHRTVNWAHPDVAAEDRQLVLPGMGLFVLMNTVIDVFGGELAVRSGQHFMNLRRGNSAGRDGLPRLRAKIKVGASQNALLGNMITARIPTMGAHAAET